MKSCASLRTRVRLLCSTIVLAALFCPQSSFAQVPANNTCGGAYTITSMPTCIVGTSKLINQTLQNATTDNYATTCGVSDAQDVWYIFQAKSDNPTITVDNLGGSWGTRLRIQLFSRTGACTGLAQVTGGCATNAPLVAAGLTVGNFYYVRVHKSNNTNPTGSAWTFDICITDPLPSNDECSGAVPLTPALTCGTFTDYMYAATASSVPVTPCTGPVTYDLWYSFVAPAANSTITIAPGSNLTNVRTQLFEGGDCSFLTSYACGTSTLAATGLEPGETYFVRVYMTTGSSPTTTTNNNFNICVTYTAPAAPANDNCAGAITLTSNSVCNKTIGTVVSATASGTAIPSPCATTAGLDVWYKFTATSTTPTINLGDFGANFGATRRLQVFTGATCGLMVAGNCVSGTGNSLSITPTVTVGTVVWIRVITPATTAITTAGDFTVCVTNPQPAQRGGNSYVNITKQTTGGPVQFNDILEIRMTVNITSGTIYYPRYVDSIPSNTVIVPGSTINVITNEGIVYQSFTQASDGDAANFNLTPGAGNYQIRMNVAITTGFAAGACNISTTATTNATGRVTSGDIPKGSGTIFGISYRVRVTGATGSVVTLRRGKFIYKTTNSAGAADLSLDATPYQIQVSDPLSLCVNATGVNMSQEFGGTFGTGTTLNRATDLTSPIVGYGFTAMTKYQGLGDGQYAIVKNISPRSGINRLAERASGACPTALPSQSACAQRMHGGHWDIDGDHTGTSNATGNVPLPDGDLGGYMLMVNADYIASETYRQTINNLCPNTYYEFSAWIRNICPTCGVDYTTGNNPTIKVPGVAPNLTFALDGLDRYNTGEVAYASGWSKRGFVFVTGPLQTSATFTIRNNSQGGGGNDWVMDDISVATCLPNMDYSPTLNPVVCQGNAYEIRDTIRSYFNNYTHHQWQRSTNGGTTWTDLGIARDSVPYFNAAKNAWEYVTRYQIPAANSTPANDGDLYRVLVATTTLNLANPDCRVTDGISFITVDVQPCGPVLSTELLSFTGKVSNAHALLSWTTSKEDEPLQFMVDRSEDGVNYTTIATVDGYSNPAAFMNSYNFTDPTALGGKWKYRIVLASRNGNRQYSRIIQLNRDVAITFALGNVVNPFSAKLDFDITVTDASRVDADLLDMNGKVVRHSSYNAGEGVNSLTLPNTQGLPAGVYVLQVRSNDKVVARKVLKKNVL